MKENLLLVVLMLVFVPLAGELKFFPYNSIFRVSLGTPVFFFFLLWIRKIHPVVSGFLVGIFVVAFRILLARITPNFNWVVALEQHSPVFFYYFSYAIFFFLLKINRFYDRPLLIGLAGVIVEIFASTVELSFRHLFSSMTITPKGLLQIVVLAVIRSFFVLGFFNLFTLRETQLAEKEQRKRNEQMLIYFTDLFEESIHLKKTVENAEEITRECYNLYRSLKDTAETLVFADKALKIAGQVHDIKKDNQRIYAGLSEIISDRGTADFITINEIVSIVIKSNQKYARLLGKSIAFDFISKEEHPSYHTYITLSLMNNLVANAVEAILDNGLIRLTVSRKDGHVEFLISNNGPGIPEKQKKRIFHQGFTTKYDVTGKPSTGIGLSYVKKVVENLGGEVRLQDDQNQQETVFIISLPIKSLARKDK
jgi:two-component system, sensor histidine kinase YcbA